MNSPIRATTILACATWLATLLLLLVVCPSSELLAAGLIVTFLHTGGYLGNLAVLSRQHRRLQQLILAAESSLQGKHNTQALDARESDELGRLARALRGLNNRLMDLRINVHDTGMELTWAQKELALKESLERKNRIIEATNLELEEKIRELTLLFSASRVFNSTLNTAEVIKNLTTLISHNLTVDAFTFFMKQNQDFSIEASLGGQDAAPDNRKVQDLLAKLVEEVDPLHIKDLDKDPRGRSLMLGLGYSGGSVLGIPVLAAGEPLGVMLFHRSTANGFQIEEMRLFQVFGNLAAIALRNALLFKRTNDLAVRDPLTGLFNRRAFMERLAEEWERSQRFGSPLSVLMVDVDHFKRFNDLHGHVVGDQVLVLTAGTMKEQLRAVDTLGRYGGEEFLAILPRTDVATAISVAGKLREAVAGKQHRCPDNPDQELSITVSIGVAGAAQAHTWSELMDAADRALLEAKARGRNRVVYLGAE